MIFFKQHPLANGHEFVWGFFVSTENKDHHIFQKTLNSYFPKTSLAYAFTDQVHGNHVAYVKEPGLFYKTDGLVSNLTNSVLSVYSSDCLPIVMFSSKGFGIAHAGWQGTKEQIIVELTKKLNIKEEGVLIDFLPHICEECFEVGSEFQDFFSPEVLAQKDGKYFLSLTKENEQQLKKNHIHYTYLMKALEQPHFKKFCTFKRLELPSYRRKSAGRIFSFCFLLSPEP